MGRPRVNTDKRKVSTTIQRIKQCSHSDKHQAINPPSPLAGTGQRPAAARCPPSRRFTPGVDGLPSFSHATEAEADRCVSGARQTPSGGTGPDRTGAVCSGSGGRPGLTLVSTRRRQRGFTSPRVVVRTRRGRERPRVPYQEVRRTRRQLPVWGGRIAASQVAKRRPPAAVTSAAAGCRHIRRASEGLFPPRPPRNSGEINSNTCDFFFLSFDS